MRVGRNGSEVRIVNFSESLSKKGRYSLSSRRKEGLKSTLATPILCRRLLLAHVNERE